jgi:Flp pilus assembly pilin Flp
MRMIVQLIKDQRGLAAMEATLLLAGLAGTFWAIGSSVAPAVHAYADKLTAVTERAETTLQALKAQQNATTSN